MRLHELDLVLGVAGEAIHGHDGVQPELAHDHEMPREVRAAGLDRIRAAIGILRVVLQRLDGRDEHDGVGAEVAEPADDVEELLHAHVRAEAALGDDVVGELQGDPVGDDRVVAVRDVRERTAVHERRLALERLHEIRLDRLLQQHGHRAGGPKLLGGDRLAVVGMLPTVIAPSRRRRSWRSEATAAIAITSDAAVMSKPVWRGIAVRLAAEPDRNVAQRAVVDVDAAAPADRQGVDAELVPVQDVRLEHRGEQVVRRADRVDVAGEVEVQILHRHDLRVAATGRAALDPEHGPERRLAQAQRN